MTKKNTAKVLVIDDDATILMLVERILEQNNYAPICVNNGKTGLEKAISEQPNAIILDRRMPQMDGNETLTQLKANNITQNIPVIMLTGDTQITDISTSLELGAADYVVKPFDKNNFLIRLAQVLR